MDANPRSPAARMDISEARMLLYVSARSPHTMCACSSVGLERRSPEPKVAGSNPARRTTYLFKK